MSLPSEPIVLIPEHDILEQVNHLGTTKWDLTNQQVRQILAEYTAVFAKDDLDLG